MTNVEQPTVQIPEEGRQPVAWKVAVVINESRSLTVIFPQAPLAETAEVNPEADTPNG